MPMGAGAEEVQVEVMMTMGAPVVVQVEVTPVDQVQETAGPVLRETLVLMLVTMVDLVTRPPSAGHPTVSDSANGYQQGCSG